MRPSPPRRRQATSGPLAVLLALTFAGCLSSGPDADDLAKLRGEVDGLQASLAEVRAEHARFVNRSLAHDQVMVSLVGAIEDLQVEHSDIVDHFLAELQDDAHGADLEELELAGRVADASLPSVVKVLAELDGGTTATGTGWAWADGLVVTASHTVSMGELRVVTRGGDSLDASVVASSTVQDLALLRVPGLVLPALPRADGPAGLGDLLVGIGHPQGYAPWSVSLGRATSVSDGSQPRVLSTVPIGPGSSGGPVLDADGRVAGMTIGGQWPAASDHAPASTQPIHVHVAPLTSGAEAAVHVPIAVVAGLVDGWLGQAETARPS
jgi:S1-C subfamily serine protease